MGYSSFTIPQGPSIFMVDHESERDISWINKSIVYCRDTLSTYVLDNGLWNQINRQTLPQFFVNGVFKNSARVEVVTGTVTSGIATFYITDDNTSTGNALFTNVYYVNAGILDDSANYAWGTYTLAANKKSITMNAKKQAFGGVTILGINVLGSVSFTNVPNGTTVYLIVIGD